MFCYFYFPLGLILLTAGALTDPQLPATASNECTTDARLGGVGRVPPQTKILAMPVFTAYESSMFLFHVEYTRAYAFISLRIMLMLMLLMYISCELP